MALADVDGDGDLDAFDEQVVDLAGEASAFGLEGTDLTAEVVGLAAEFGETDVFFGLGIHGVCGTESTLADCSALVKHLSANTL